MVKLTQDGFDLPGYFLQTNMEEFLLLRVDGALLALLLVKLDWKRWKKYLRHHAGKNPVIYASCDKAIHGTVTAALLSCKKLIGYLLDWGFEMKVYNP